LRCCSPAPDLRPARPDDEPFLRSLYANLRAPEFSALALAPDALSALLALQYTAQDRSYRHSHPGADRDIVVVDGEPIGRLYADRGTETIHVIDVTLLAQHRGRGLGTALLTAVLDDARRSSRTVGLEVARGGRALRLYRRLGFEVVGEDDVYLELEWRPEPIS
jgi:ribosomal protein S18 acetylase RimI-like enzyme